MSRRHVLPFLILLGSSTALAAQDGTTVGPPSLKDFELPGTRETPPAEPQDVPETEPEAEARQPAPQPPQPEPRVQAPPVRQAPRPQPQAAVPEPVAEAPAVAEPLLPPPASEVPPPEPTAQPPAEAPAPADDLPVWWAAAGGAAALLLIAALLLRRRRKQSDRIEVAPEPIAIVPPPPPRSVVPAAPRLEVPKLEVVFTAERMVTTDKDVTVHFALRVKNAGTVQVRNLLIDARMFSAGPEQMPEIAAFLKAPLGEGASAVPFNLEPGRGAEFGNQVYMPREETRAILLQGRSLFVPTVAVKIGYGYGDDADAKFTGSYLVGIQPKDPAQKMGAFRLDVGPRIYRSVAQREIEIA